MAIVSLTNKYQLIKDADNCVLFLLPKYCIPYSWHKVSHINGMKNKSKVPVAQQYLKDLQSAYGDSEDFRVRTLALKPEVVVVSLDTMCDDNKISHCVLEPLLCLAQQTLSADIVEQKLSFAVKVTKAVNYEHMTESFFNGYTLIFIQGESKVVCADTRIALGRAVMEPPTSIVLSGPREGFVEDVKTNLTLLRKRLKTERFKTVELSVGKYTNTNVTVCYIDDIVKKDVLEEILQRISAIDTDGILDSSYLSSYLESHRTLLFNRVGSTEKPDVVCGKLLEGRVAIIVDGSPMVLTCPYLFIEDLQAPGDYHQSSDITSISRVLRFISVIVSVFLPAMFVCLEKYNYQIIPLKFLITVLNATEAIPFSPLTEMLLVIVIFDILREANLRMPTAVGMSLSLVGAIVLGDAAVKAGLLGAPAVMVGALSGIGLYTMPQNTLVLSLLRLIFTFIGGVMGLLGVIIGIMALIAYMVSMQDYGVPFLAPYAPAIPHDKQDAVLQSPLARQHKRPQSLNNTHNATRRGK